MITKIKKVKDPGSAVTHFIGMMMAIFSSIPLLIRAGKNPGHVHTISLAIFIISMILLYFASTIYHTLNISEKVNQRLKKFDHMMIYLLIAGTYTPICTIALDGIVGIALLCTVWGLAIVGIIITGFWVNSPKWLSSAVYIAMGWTCVLAFTQIINSLSTKAFFWLLAGGIIYTVGGIIYALKLPIFNSKYKYFGSHELFHLFVMAGSLCHFLLMYKYIALMPLT